MTFTFYQVDEADMPPDPAQPANRATHSPSTHSTAVAITPAELIALIRDRGGFWYSVEATPDEYAALWQTLDRFVGDHGFLPEIAFSGSPNYLLAGRPGSWRLGYLPASLVPHLTGAFRIQSDDLEAALQNSSPGEQRLWQALNAIMDGASEREMGIAIIHEPV